jgi:hypothetical protein
MYGAQYLSFAGFTSSYCECYDLHPSPCGAYGDSQGRMMNPNSDPDLLDPQSFNEYSYANNKLTSPEQGEAPLSTRDQGRYDANRDNLLNQLQNTSDPCSTLLGQAGYTPQMVRDAVKDQKPWNGKKSWITNREAGTVSGP